MKDFNLKKYLTENKLVKEEEIKYKNTDTVKEDMKEYLEQVFNAGEKDHMEDMMNILKALFEKASEYMEEM
ncbi:MAG: hypothetical protein CMC82_03700 [Flavobacteriaceae bacterium]|nr:hypothetical protein [Flavobacteriaceae bacterium]